MAANERSEGGYYKCTTNKYFSRFVRWPTKGGKTIYKKKSFSCSDACFNASRSAAFAAFAASFATYTSVYSQSKFDHHASPSVSRTFSSSHSWHGSKPCHWFQQSPIWRLARRLPDLSGQSLQKKLVRALCWYKSHEGMPSTLAQALHGKTSTKSFTALFTARDGGHPVGSSAGCGPFPTCYRSHERLGRWGRRGGGPESHQFCPVMCKNGSYLKQTKGYGGHKASLLSGGTSQSIVHGQKGGV